MVGVDFFARTPDPEAKIPEVEGSDDEMVTELGGFFGFLFGNSGLFPWPRKCVGGHAMTISWVLC